MMKSLLVFGILGVLCICNGVLSISLEKANLVDVHYHLWFEDDMSNEIPLKQIVKGVDNSTLFEIMELADDNNEDYKFEYITYPFGRYITSIGGRKEDKDNKIYWMIFQLKNDPSTESPPGDEDLTPYGVDGMRVKHNERYLFWRKKVDDHKI